MVCSVLTVDNEIVDYKITEKEKDISDFSKSLFIAGYPFYLSEGVKVENCTFRNQSDAIRWLTTFRMAKKRCFSSITAGFSVKKIYYCNTCGYTIKTEYNFCPICGTETN